MSITATMALHRSPFLFPYTCHPRACVIYKVVTAIRFNVISCHLNTYILGRYYKACNGGASRLLCGSFEDIWQHVIGCTERETYSGINPPGAR